MIITRTPLRVSLAGGGTDYPEWCREHGGAVIGFALDRYVYVAVRQLPPFFPAYRHRLCYSEVELTNTVPEIKHPAIRACLQEHPVDALELVHWADLPARSGLGSSSSFVVGLLRGLFQLQGTDEGPDPNDRWFAHEAIHIERDVIGEAVGYQDQVWAAHGGGLTRIDFPAKNGLNYTRTPLYGRELCESLLLVFSGISRYATVHAAQQVQNIERNATALHRMRAMVDECEQIIRQSDRLPYDLGRLLHESWMLKRGLAHGVATPEVDCIYEHALAAGAHGGKLLGAGGGGFMLFAVDPERRDALARALAPLVSVPVGVDVGG